MGGRLGVALTLGLLVPAGQGRADDTHYQDYVIGGRAIGLGGAFTALGDDPSGVFYNPAGLCDSRHESLQVNASMYGFERGTTTLDVPVPGLRDLQIGFTELIIVPASGGFVSTIGRPDEDGRYDQAYGLLVAVPSYRSFAKRDAPLDDGATEAVYSRRVVDRSLWAGLGYSQRVLPSLQLGVSGFYILRSVVDTEDLSIAVPLGDGQHAFRAAANNLDFLSGSVALGAGVRWVTRDAAGGSWMLGAQLRSPSLRVHTQGNLLFTRHSADPSAPPGAQATYQRISRERVESSSAEGVNLRAGLAYARARSLTLAGDVSFHGPARYTLVDLDDDQARSVPFATEIVRRPVVNFNLGAEFLVIREVSIAAGLFSDFSSAPPVPDLPERPYLPRIDLMGFSAALGYFGDYTLSRVGFVYSAGRGQSVRPADDAGRLLEQRQSFVSETLFQSFFYVFVSGAFRY